MIFVATINASLKQKKLGIFIDVVFYYYFFRQESPFSSNINYFKTHLFLSSLGSVRICLLGPAPFVSSKAQLQCDGLQHRLELIAGLKSRICSAFRFSCSTFYD